MQMQMSPLNAVICGRNELTASVIRILRRNKYVNIVGYWCDSVKSQLHADVAGIKVIGGTFEDLLSNKEIHFLFLCDTPLNQQSFVSRLCDQIKCFQNSNVKQVSDLPYVIVFPPFSPNYDFELLKLFRNKVGVAMPFRRLPVSALLSRHINRNKQLKFSETYESVQLPAHWDLGNLEKIHIRLSTINLIENCEYSWLCESGNMGGGLLNIFCSSLIDLVYSLTGLQLTSVTCVCRTYGGSLSGRERSLHRISSDDYVSVLGELDVASLTESRKPIVVIVISSDIPFSEDVTCKRSEVYSCDNHRFKLQVEICGSAGCFVADESERQISWTSRKSCSPKAKYVSDEYSTVRPKHDCNGFSHERPVQRVNGTELTNGRDHFESYSTGVVETQSNHFPRTRAISKPPFHIEKVNEITEVARLPLNDSTYNLESGEGVQYCQLSVIGESWSNWFSSLTTNLPSVESLIALPSHWSYIQSVIQALDKSARLRCWIDVQTGERM
uniref:Uncharacterized protein n=2 Tax=Trichobilharzia regenti TaxID=157069 RepID=A0AA85IQN2_TRIRE|nr:unnamed protein product [Trichobilharzia regenti]